MALWARLRERGKSERSRHRCYAGDLPREILLFIQFPFAVVSNHCLCCKYPLPIKSAILLRSHGSLKYPSMVTCVQVSQSPLRMLVTMSLNPTVVTIPILQIGKNCSEVKQLFQDHTGILGTSRKTPSPAP